MDAEYDLSEAKGYLKKFLDAWKDHDYAKMVAASTATYQDQIDPVKDLAVRIPFELKGYGIKKATLYTSVVCDVVVKVIYEGKRMTLQIRLIKEVAPYVPVLGGTWGVSPMSIRPIK